MVYFIEVSAKMSNYKKKVMLAIVGFVFLAIDKIRSVSNLNIKKRQKCANTVTVTEKDQTPKGLH